MATTKNTTGAGNGAKSQTELRMIPLSRVIVKDGFNPRGEIVEDDALRAMAETMRERGCLQTIRVRANGSGDFELIAGGRRYRAAALAALTEMPAIVLPEGAGDEAEQLELLTDAVIENELRSDLNPLQRAQGYQAMLDLGQNVRGVAEKLGGKTKRASREQRIRQHLPILALPADLREQIADGTIPLMAVKALAEVCKIHPDLAYAAVATTSGEEYDRYSWSEVAEDALAIAVGELDELPSGIYQSGARYPLSMFTLSEKASKDLIAYRKIAGDEAGQSIGFGPAFVEQARVLGAVQPLGTRGSLIVGQDVADQLAGDIIAFALKDARAEQRRQRDEQKAREAKLGSSSSAGSNGDGKSGAGETPERREEREREQAKAERQAELEKRREATAFNEALGLLFFKHLPKIKIDDRVLRILASVNLAGDLRGIASRGARLALPGWFELSTKGKPKHVYLEPTDATDRARRFLAEAQSAGEIAGRALTLIGLASLVDEEAVAFSRRAYYTLVFQGPWALQAQRDLNAIVRERIKEEQLPDLDAILAARVAEDEQAAAREVEIETARRRLDGLYERRAELGQAELAQAVADVELVHGEFSIEAVQWRGEQERRAEDAGDRPSADETRAEVAA
jgi:ParB/RepB/Spo0J family partition protein